MLVVIPKDVNDTTHPTTVPSKNAVTILLEGNKNRNIYYFTGAFEKTTSINEINIDSFPHFVQEKNKLLIADMNQLRLQKEKGGLSDSLFNTRKLEIESQHTNDAPVFIISWGGNAKYSDVINILDLLKTEDATKYALVPISKEMLTLLSAKTGIIYPELQQH